MSSPIAIPRSPKATSYAAAAASPGSSSAMSVSMGSPKSSGVYVPLHKRTPSSPSSPTRALPTTGNGVSSTAAAPHPLIYSPSFLLSLRSVPLSTSQTTIMKFKIQETSPEVADKVVMNRRMRKSLEFKGPKKPSVKANSTPNSTTAPLPQKAVVPAPAPTASAPQPATTPVQAKHTRPAARRTRSSTSRPRRQIILRATRGAAARAIGIRESWRSSTNGVSQAVAVA